MTRYKQGDLTLNEIREYKYVGNLIGNEVMHGNVPIGPLEIYEHPDNPKLTYKVATDHNLYRLTDGAENLEQWLEVKPTKNDNDK